MILKAKPFSLPRGIYFEYLPDEENLYADAKNMVEQVALMALIVNGKEPADERLVALMYRLVTVGYLSHMLDNHDTMVIQTVVNDDLQTTIHDLRQDIFEMAMGRRPIPSELAPGLTQILKNPVSI